MSELKQSLISSTIKNYSNQLFNFIKRKVDSIEDAEDILQEVWYQFSKLSNLDELQSMSGWLYHVAKNKVKDLYKKKKNESLEDYVYEDEEGGFSFKEILLLDDSSNPELGLFKELFWNELMKALDELPINQKEVFILNEIEELTLKEIAEQKNENLKTIISRKGYAVAYLRKKLHYLYQELNM